MNGSRLATLLAALLIASLPDAGHSAASLSPVAIARAVRLRGCHGHAGTRVPLRDLGGLGDAALDLGRGLTLKAAIARAGYREEQSTAVHVSGDAAALQHALETQLCETVVDAGFSDFGAAQHGHDTWMIFAVPFAPPAAAQSEHVGAEVLERINAARAQPRRCGSRLFPAAPPLQPNRLLRAAAEAHARDMLEHSFFAHEGRDGSNPAQRVTLTGYRYHLVGENIALGPANAQEAVDGWIASPGHCENLMDARFTESGIAYSASSSGPPRIYWVQEFAAPR